MHLANPLNLSVEEAALGVIKIATANMARAIRSVSTEHGHDVANFALYAFGGAGALHAAEVAVECGIHRIVIPQEPGTLCARGVLTSDLSRDYVRTLLVTADAEGWQETLRLADTLTETGRTWLREETPDGAEQELNVSLDARYAGQSHAIAVPMTVEAGVDAFCDAFHAAHADQFGYRLERRKVEIVNLRLQAVSRVSGDRGANFQNQTTLQDALINHRPVRFDDGWQDTPVYRRGLIPVGLAFAGPAIIEEMSGTTVVLPGQGITLDPTGNIHLTLQA